MEYVLKVSYAEEARRIPARLPEGAKPSEVMAAITKAVRAAFSDVLRDADFQLKGSNGVLKEESVTEYLAGAASNKLLKLSLEIQGQGSSKGPRSNANVSGIISAAIGQGAPAYNMGQIAVCASIYAETASRLLRDHGQDLLPNVRQSLDQTLEESKRSSLGGSQGKGSTADRLAWDFRRAFDDQLAAPSETREPSRKSGQSVAAEIENAIAQGAPTYNRGDVAGCVRIYTETARSLLLRSDLGNAAEQNLRTAVLRCESMPEDVNGNAWALRRALDATAAQRQDTGSSSGSLKATSAGNLKGTLIRNFSMGAGLDLQATCVNDTVMGGRSSSNLRMTADGALFEGMVTKQGGGGFVSLRLQGGFPLVEALRSRKGLSCSVRCLEGCSSWKLQLNEGMNGVQWQAGFTAGTRDFETVQVPFASFQPTWRGMPQGGRGISDEALGRIQGVGFMLSFLDDDGSRSASFKEGKFALLINWIASY